MRTVNKITLIGVVGRDPEVFTTNDGKVAHVSLATKRGAVGDEFARTDWHRITLRGRQAQFAEDYVHTGDRIYVEGRLEYGSYERDRLTIPTAEIIGSEVVMMSRSDEP